MKKAQIIQIIQLGQPVLRKVAKRIKNASSAETQGIIDDLLLICEKTEAMGIAAPQIGKSIRLIIVNFVARVFQHELDHLDGIMFLDHAKNSEIITEKEYLRIMKKEIQRK